MNVGGSLILALVVVVVIAYFARRRDLARRADFLRRIGFAMTAIFGGFFGLFIIGETLSDPGGWQGVGLVALWLVPLTAVCLLAWFRPGAASVVFVPLVGVVVALSVWSAVDPSGWRAFENRNGPVRDVIVFAVATALALWGLRRTALAGVMLLVVGALPILVASASDMGAASLAVVSSTPVITGLLYLASAQQDRRRPPPIASSRSERPKAA